MHLSGRYDRDQLVALLVEHNPGFDRAMFTESLGFSPASRTERRHYDARSPVGSTYTSDGRNAANWLELVHAHHGVLGPPEAGHAYPAGSLTGRGKIGDRTVDCIAAEWVVKFHDAYPGDADDRADVLALCRRFDLTVPSQYRG